jgi:hypothetical protein
MTSLPAKRIVLFASKFGYQTVARAAARKLGIQPGYVTDRCHELNDPWATKSAVLRPPRRSRSYCNSPLRGKPLDAIRSVMHPPSLPVILHGASASFETIRCR